jgi:hypothetical protein
MKVKYYLLDNPMTSDPNDRKAQIFDYEVISEEDILEYITRQGSGITMGQAKANYEEIIGAHEYFLRRGAGINTEFLNIRPVVQGVFRDDDDKFDNGRHKLKYRTRLGRRYNRVTEDVKMEKVAPVSNAPLLVSIEDIASGTVNDTITPGGVATLSGMRLNFKKDDPQQGIFLIDAAKNEHHIERTLSHTGKQIVFVIPATLTPDEYTLELRVLPSGNKELKIGVLVDRLSV